MNINFYKTNYVFRRSLICVLLLLAAPVFAMECGDLQLYSDRSSGIQVQGNNCTDSSFLSEGARINVASKGRLWVRSIQDSNNAYQMICQNSGSGSVNLEFSGTTPPFLNLASLTNCQGWANNKLSCSGSQAEKSALYCVLSRKRIKAAGEKKIERTTSVKMRDITQMLKAKKEIAEQRNQTVIDDIAPELKICKDLYQIAGKVEVDWTVENNQAQETINIISPEKNDQGVLSECVESVITTFSYPGINRKTSFNMTL